MTTQVENNIENRKHIIADSIKDENLCLVNSNIVNSNKYENNISLDKENKVL